MFHRMGSNLDQGRRDVCRVNYNIEMYNYKEFEQITTTTTPDDDDDDDDYYYFDQNV